MQRTWILFPALLLALGFAAAQTAGNTDQTGSNRAPSGNQSSSDTSGAAGSKPNGSSGQSSTNSAGANQSSTSQVGTAGTSANTSSVASNSANPSSPSSNNQSSTNSGANNAYPTDQNSATGNDQMGAQANATGASTGVGVSAKPNRNNGATGRSAVPQNDQGTSGTKTTTPRVDQSSTGDRNRRDATAFGSGAENPAAVAQSGTAPRNAQLPQTASALPLLSVMGFGTLLAGLIVKFRR